MTTEPALSTGLKHYCTWCEGYHDYELARDGALSTTCPAGGKHVVVFSMIRTSAGRYRRYCLKCGLFDTYIREE